MDNNLRIQLFDLLTKARYIDSAWWHEKKSVCACFSFSPSGRDEDFRVTAADLEDLLDYVESEISELFVDEDAGLEAIFHAAQFPAEARLGPDALQYHDDLMKMRKKLFAIGELMGMEMTDFGPVFSPETPA